MKPSVFEAVGNGSYIYRWNIEQVDAPASADAEEESAEPRKQWQCEEVVIWAPVSANKITEAVLTHLWPANYEQKLANEYNAANLGLYGAKTSEAAKAKIQAYTDFLTARAAVKTQIDEDCEELGIK